MQVCISRKDAHPKMRDGMLQRKDERQHATELKGTGFGNRHYHLLCDLGILLIQRGFGFPSIRGGITVLFIR